jgi:hypothetical protein
MNLALRVPAKIESVIRAPKAAPLGPNGVPGEKILLQEIFNFHDTHLRSDGQLITRSGCINRMEINSALSGPKRTGRTTGGGQVLLFAFFLSRWIILLTVE